MDEFYHSFINLVFIGIIALFPVINPIGSAFIVSPYFLNLNKKDKRKVVQNVSLYAFLICMVSLFAGQWILKLFGISIPIIQLAGGIMICKIGWGFLSSDKTTQVQPRDAALNNTDDGYEQVASKLFYPIAFPITTGPGTISVLFTLSAHSAANNTNGYLINTLALLVSVLVMCTLIYIFYFNTKTLINFLGENGENIVNRISAFLIFCVGLQIAFTGLKILFKF
ncbi:MarC family protein [uncultured Mucilaginibacter sp.]|uniref:MarC family protein n=1 Tax=uncultured Mucilaginibacter sp. TaxID=797541 RepID=UPI00262A7C34|nr:MarC family protein [uncultured Mucilaginibacter sp.]